MRKLGFTLSLCFSLAMTGVSFGQTTGPFIEQADLASPVDVPAGDVLAVIFVPGSTAALDGPTPPNADLFFVGGNATGPQGFIASATCGLTDLTSPGAIGFPGSNFLIALGDSAGTVLASNHTDNVTIDAGTALACQTDLDIDGDGTPDGTNFISTDNAYAQVLSLPTETTVESVLFALTIATEANIPEDFLIDFDGDGVADPIIFDGFVPYRVMMFFGVDETGVAFDTLGSDAGSPVADVDEIMFVDVGCAAPFGDINDDGMVDLFDISPFVGQLTGDDPICQADINRDGEVSLFDIAPFVELLSGG